MFEGNVHDFVLYIMLSQALMVLFNLVLDFKMEQKEDSIIITMLEH